MWIERPLATLPAADVERLVRALFAPDQRLARSFRHYWRTVRGHDEPTARLETLIDLRHDADELIARRDPELHAIGFQRVVASWEDAGGPAAYQAEGVFGYRALADHPLGASIAEVVEHVPSRPVAANDAHAIGFAYDLAVLDLGAEVDVAAELLAAIGRTARRAGHARVVVTTADRDLALQLACGGVELLPELALPDRKQIAGLFELARRAPRQARAA